MSRHHRAALEHKQLRQLALASDCAVCGQRLGKHRFGDDCCPNPAWKPGNRQPQWSEGSYYREAGTSEAEWQQKLGYNVWEKNNEP